MKPAILLAATLLAAACATALLALGSFLVPSQNLLRALLVACAAAALVLPPAAVRLRNAPGPLRAAALVAGLGGAIALGTFLTALFRAPDGEVAVRRQVASPAAAPERLRVADLNVLHGYPDFTDQERRAERLTTALAALGADIYVLQEVWVTTPHGHLARRLSRELGLDLAYARANGSRRFLGFEEGLAVLSRFPVRSARRRSLSPRRPLKERRIALVVEIDLGAGESLTVVNLHLTNRLPEVADAQAADLARRLAEAPSLLVAGDFNRGDDTPALEAFTRPRAPGGVFLDALPGGIDHLLVPAAGPWRVARAEWTLKPRDLETPLGETVEISDHPGILVELVRTR